MSAMNVHVNDAQPGQCVQDTYAYQQPQYNTNYSYEWDASVMNENSVLDGQYERGVQDTYVNPHTQYNHNVHVTSAGVGNEYVHYDGFSEQSAHDASHSDVYGTGVGGYRDQSVYGGYPYGTQDVDSAGTCPYNAYGIGTPDLGRCYEASSTETHHSDTASVNDCETIPEYGEHVEHVDYLMYDRNASDVQSHVSNDDNDSGFDNGVGNFSEDS